MAVLSQDFDERTGDPLVTLGRLIGIRVRADRNGLATVTGLGKFALKNLRGIVLGKEPSFEVQTRRQVQIRVRWARVAVNTAMFAALIGIDRLTERYIGRIVAANNAAHGLSGYRSRDCSELQVLRTLAVIKARAPVRQIARIRIDSRPASRFSLFLHQCNLDNFLSISLERALTCAASAAIGSSSR